MPPSCHPERSEAESRDLKTFFVGEKEKILRHFVPQNDKRIFRQERPIKKGKPGRKVRALNRRCPSSCHPERSEAESKDLKTFFVGEKEKILRHFVPQNDKRIFRQERPIKKGKPGRKVRALNRRCPSSCHPERSEAESKDLKTFFVGEKEKILRHFVPQNDKRIFHQERQIKTGKPGRKVRAFLFAFW